MHDESDEHGQGTRNTHTIWLPSMPRVPSCQHWCQLECLDGVLGLSACIVGFDRVARKKRVLMMDLELVDGPAY